MGKFDEVRLGFETAYIDESVVSSDMYRPQFVPNNNKKGKKVLSSIEDEIYRIIIGSSNITSAALTSNREWNTKLISTEQGEVTKEIVAEFNELWSSKYSLSFEDFMRMIKHSPHF